MRRIQELVAAATQKYSNDPFFDRFEESCRENMVKKKVYRTYDDALQALDRESWEVLKIKALNHFQDHRTGQLKQGFFNQLNEAFAYRHLVRQGYRRVKLLTEQGRRVPDLQYFDGRLLRHCEVKTIGISEEEISRRSSHEVFTNTYPRLSAGFLKKLAGAITKARIQIEAQGTSGLVYLLVFLDDIALDYYQDYRHQLTQFTQDNKINDVHIKFGLRFNRHMRLTYASVACHTDAVLCRVVRARPILTRISSTLAIQVNTRGRVLW
jgi:hypothetical protein